MIRFKELFESQSFEAIKELQEELKDSEFFPMHDIIAFGESGEGVELDDLVKELRSVDKSLAKEVASLSKTMMDQNKVYNEEVFYPKFKKLADSKGFDWYDSSNCRIACKTPASYSDDMNGADWRSVKSISDFLKKNDKKLFKIFDDVWNKRYVSQEDIYDIAEEIQELEV
jgi:hypothetical protein